MARNCWQLIFNSVAVGPPAILINLIAICSSIAVGAAGDVPFWNFNKETTLSEKTSIVEIRIQRENLGDLDEKVVFPIELYSAPNAKKVSCELSQLTNVNAPNDCGVEIFGITSGFNGELPKLPVTIYLISEEKKGDWHRLRMKEKGSTRALWLKEGTPAYPISKWISQFPFASVNSTIDLFEEASYKSPKQNLSCGLWRLETKGLWMRIECRNMDCANEHILSACAPKEGFYPCQEEGIDFGAYKKLPICKKGWIHSLKSNGALQILPDRPSWED
jgi:hypothetical protein